MDSSSSCSSGKIAVEKQEQKKHNELLQTKLNRQAIKRTTTAVALSKDNNDVHTKEQKQTKKLKEDNFVEQIDQPIVTEQTEPSDEATDFSVPHIEQMAIESKPDALVNATELSDCVESLSSSQENTGTVTATLSGEISDLPSSQEQSHSVGEGAYSEDVDFDGLSTAIDFETEDSDDGNERLNPKTRVERDIDSNKGVYFWFFFLKFNI